MSHPVWYIKIMIMKTENATLIPPVPESGWIGQDKPKLGWLQIDTKIWCIRDWHSFDDFGSTMETLTIERGGETKEIFSLDEGETFTFDLQELQNGSIIIYQHYCIYVRDDDYPH